MGRTCQPGPSARSLASTSGSRRVDNNPFAFGSLYQLPKRATGIRVAFGARPQPRTLRVSAAPPTPRAYRSAQVAAGIRSAALATANKGIATTDFGIVEDLLGQLRRVIRVNSPGFTDRLRAPSGVALLHLPALLKSCLIEMTCRALPRGVQTTITKRPARKPAVVERSPPRSNRVSSIVPVTPANPSAASTDSRQNPPDLRVSTLLQGRVPDHVRCFLHQRRAWPVACGPAQAQDRGLENRAPLPRRMRP